MKNIDTLIDEFNNLIRKSKKNDNIVNTYIKTISKINDIDEITIFFNATINSFDTNNKLIIYKELLNILSKVLNDIPAIYTFIKNNFDINSNIYSLYLSILEKHIVSNKYNSEELHNLFPLVSTLVNDYKGNDIYISLHLHSLYSYINDLLFIDRDNIQKEYLIDHKSRVELKEEILTSNNPDLYSLLRISLIEALETNDITLSTLDEDLKTIDSNNKDLLKSIHSIIDTLKYDSNHITLDNLSKLAINKLKYLRYINKRTDINQIDISYKLNYLSDYSPGYSYIENEFIDLEYLSNNFWNSDSINRWIDIISNNRNKFSLDVYPLYPILFTSFKSIILKKNLYITNDSLNKFKSFILDSSLKEIATDINYVFDFIFDVNNIDIDKLTTIIDKYNVLGNRNIKQYLHSTYIDRIKGNRLSLTIDKFNDNHDLIVDVYLKYGLTVTDKEFNEGILKFINIHKSKDCYKECYKLIESLIDERISLDIVLAIKDDIKVLDINQSKLFNYIQSILYKLYTISVKVTAIKNNIEIEIVDGNQHEIHKALTYLSKTPFKAKISGYLDKQFKAIENNKNLDKQLTRNKALINEKQFLDTTSLHTKRDIVERYIYLLRNKKEIDTALRISLMKIDIGNMALNAASLLNDIKDRSIDLNINPIKVAKQHKHYDLIRNIYSDIALRFNNINFANASLTIYSNTDKNKLNIKDSLKIVKLYELVNNRFIDDPNLLSIVESTLTSIPLYRYIPKDIIDLYTMYLSNVDTERWENVRNVIYPLLKLQDRNIKLLSLNLFKRFVGNVGTFEEYCTMLFTDSPSILDDLFKILEEFHSNEQYIDIALDIVSKCKYKYTENNDIIYELIRSLRILRNLSKNLNTFSISDLIKNNDRNLHTIRIVSKLLENSDFDQNNLGSSLLGLLNYVDSYITYLTDISLTSQQRSNIVKDIFVELSSNNPEYSSYIRNYNSDLNIIAHESRSIEENTYNKFTNIVKYISDFSSMEEIITMYYVSIRANIFTFNALKSIIRASADDFIEIVSELDSINLERFISNIKSIEVRTPMEVFVYNHLLTNLIELVMAMKERVFYNFNTDIKSSESILGTTEALSMKLNSILSTLTDNISLFDNYPHKDLLRIILNSWNLTHEELVRSLYEVIDEQYIIPFNDGKENNEELLVDMHNMFDPDSLPIENRYLKVNISLIYVDALVECIRIGEYRSSGNINILSHILTKQSKPNIHDNMFRLLEAANFICVSFNRYYSHEDINYKIENIKSILGMLNNLNIATKKFTTDLSLLRIANISHKLIFIIEEVMDDFNHIASNVEGRALYEVTRAAIKEFHNFVTHYPNTQMRRIIFNKMSTSISEMNRISGEGSTRNRRNDRGGDLSLRVRMR